MHPLGPGRAPPSTVERGHSAESLACSALVRAGYTVVERNFRCRAGEIDIVAREGRVLCFVEVRSRADGKHGHAAEMVGPRKRAYVSRVAGVYLALRRPRYSEARFDIVAITGPRLDILRDAWRL